MNFEHDEIKASENIKKHKVTFEEAQTVWADPHAQEFNDDEAIRGEERYLRIGYSARHRMLLVVYCERDNGDTVRIISARKATLQERIQYEG